MVVFQGHRGCLVFQSWCSPIRVLAFSLGDGCCVCVCMHAFICVCVCMCVFECMYGCMHVFVYVFLNVGIHVVMVWMNCVCMHVCCDGMYVHVYVCCDGTYMYVYVAVVMVCMCVCMFACVLTLLSFFVPVHFFCGFSSCRILDQLSLHLEGVFFLLFCVLILLPPITSWGPMLSAVR